MTYLLSMWRLHSDTCSDHPYDVYKPENRYEDNRLSHFLEIPPRSEKVIPYAWEILVIASAFFDSLFLLLFSKYMTCLFAKQWL